MYCANCGTSQSGVGSFCPGCGQRLIASGEADVATAQEPPRSATHKSLPSTGERDSSAGGEQPSRTPGSPSPVEFKIPGSEEPSAEPPLPSNGGRSIIHWLGKMDGRTRVLVTTGALVLVTALVGVVIAAASSGSGSGSTSGGVDTSSVGYRDGYQTGYNMAVNGLPAYSDADGKGKCDAAVEVGSINPLPGENLDDARQGCYDGVRDFTGGSFDPNRAK